MSEAYSNTQKLQVRFGAWLIFSSPTIAELRLNSCSSNCSTTKTFQVCWICFLSSHRWYTRLRLFTAAWDVLSSCSASTQAAALTKQWYASEQGWWCKHTKISQENQEISKKNRDATKSQKIVSDMFFFKWMISAADIHDWQQQLPMISAADCQIHQ